MLEAITVDRDADFLARHARAPYADALRSLASHDWQRLHVPAHSGRAVNAPGLANLVGEHALHLDFPMLFSGVDQHDWGLTKPGRITPIMQAQALAAEAWGASRTWFITTGASGCNHIATSVVRGLGREFIVQRSVHSSVIDTRGAGITGSDAHYLLLRDHRIYCELATESALVLLLSAPSTPTVAFRPTRLPRILLECRTCCQEKCWAPRSRTQGVPCRKQLVIRSKNSTAGCAAG